jgi:hypothetical protein
LKDRHLSNRSLITTTAIYLRTYESHEPENSQARITA